MGANLYKQLELIAEAKEAWLWLRNLKEYRAAFKRQVALQRTGDLALYEVPQQSSKVFAGGLVDLRKQIINQQLVKKVWGFYPLQDPRKNRCPSKLVDFFEELYPEDVKPAVEGLNFSSSALSFYKLNLGALKKEKPLLPEYLDLRIDYKRTKSQILYEIDRLLTKIEEEYGIVRRSTHVNLLAANYMVFISEKLGKKAYPVFVKGSKGIEAAKKKAARLKKHLKERTKKF